MTNDSLDMLASRFRRDGFVHVPGVLNAGEVKRYGAAVDAAVAQRKRRDTRALDEKSPYEQSFIQCQYLWEDFPAVRPLTFHPRAGQLAAALLDTARIRLWHDQALYKEPGGRETEAHQDHPYWPIVERDAVTIWIALCDVDDRIGCMGYVPGSHRGDAEFVDIFGSPGDGKKLADRFAETPPVFVPCRAGDAIFHHGHTVHTAKPNRSDRMRRVYTAIYFRDGCTRSETTFHPSVDRAGIGVGEAIASDVTPIAWPREDDELPAPVPWPKLDNARARRAIEIGIIPGSD